MAQIRRTVSHKLGWSGLPDYEIRGNQIYRTVSHPDGWSGLPDYEIRGNQTTEPFRILRAGLVCRNMKSEATRSFVQ